MGLLDALYLESPDFIFLSLREGDELYISFHVFQRYRKIGTALLVCKGIFNTLMETKYAYLIACLKGRSKKRETLDMAPVEMRDEYIEDSIGLAHPLHYKAGVDVAQFA